MSGLEWMLLSYLLNSLWQIPLLVLAAWIAAHVLRPLGPALEHRVWVGALVLEGVLPGMSMLPWERVRLAWPWHAHAAQMVEGSVTVQMGAGAGFAALPFPPGLLGAMSIAYHAIQEITSALGQNILEGQVTFSERVLKALLYVVNDMEHVKVRDIYTHQQRIDYANRIPSNLASGASGGGTGSASAKQKAQKGSPISSVAQVSKWTRCLARTSALL